MKRIFYFGLALITSLFSCQEDIKQPDRSDPGVNINLIPSTTFQTISGFGGANQMWGSTFPNNEEIDKAFGSGDEDLGLSIFRVRIASNPNEWPLIIDVAKRAQGHGAKILASPWSPPPALKSNNSDISGHLLEENYGAYVSHLNDFISLMESNGVDIYAISIQNEPDIEVSYESCDWTSSEILNFIKNYGDKIVGAKVTSAESFNFNHAYTDMLLNDEAALNNFDIIAGHIYGGGQEAYPLAESKEKEIWMTEYLMNLNVGDWQAAEDGTKWNETMEMLGTMQTAMNNNWNAYIWWYLKRYYSFIGDGDEGTVNGEILKRGYAYSHFSKFIKPGYQRIDLETSSSIDATITAYQGEGHLVAIILNDTNATIKVNLSAAERDINKAYTFLTNISVNRGYSELEITEGKAELSISPNSVYTVILE
ncbi:hypothetical protein [Reichenbachiella ulvae]|uniref:Glycosyl hydrolase family 30 TIM-barrel domain-containing protein n=1 Tax=Reichenbachiella ulvae TaxID=2980104 RepID=A0ABT3CSR2_9BACT|nr:hypothetical protein [Reichenbachiella ulvae]MCV9386603.1 hypothetical protein [Reichenbachiella ulvae]